MKITATKENLQNAIRKAICAVGSRPILPVLSNIRLEAQGDRLILTATDNEITISTWIPALIQEEGVTTLPAKKLLQIVSALRIGDVTLETDAEHMTTLTCQKSVFHIHGLSADTFPPLENVAGEWSFEMPALDFLNGFGKVAYAKSMDESRRQMNGVNMSIRGGLLNIVATDGRRMAIIEKKLEVENPQDRDAIIPSKASNELPKCFSEASAEDKIQIQINANSLTFSMKSTQLTTKTVEGVYPPFRDALKMIGTGYSVALPRQTFIEIISRVALIVLDNAGSIQLSFTNGLLTVSANNPEMGSATETIEVNYEGAEEVSVYMNPVYFLEPLKVMDSDQVILDFEKQFKPVKLSGEEGFIYMLMPMRQ